MTTAADDPLLGTVVAGRFRLVECIGRGGMGAVYRAVQAPLEREVALKLIRHDVVDALSRQRFEREARAAARIADPRVATVYDFGSTDDGTLYLAMELVHGETLRHRLQHGPLLWPEAAHVVREVARGLGAAHERGLVHRDLKPENVMLAPSPDGLRIKVLDFGLAKEVAELTVAGASLTRSGSFIGTPGYVAPEMLRGAAEDPRQDVYALGVLLWECLVGRHPFAAETPLETIVRSMQEEVPRLEAGTARIAGAPAGLATVLAALCARDPAARPADGNVVAQQLDALRSALDAPPDMALADLTFDPEHLPPGAVRKSVDSLPPAHAIASLDPHEVTEPSRRLPAHPEQQSVPVRGMGWASPVIVALAAAAAAAIAFAALGPARAPRDDGDLMLAGAAAALASGNAAAARAQLRLVLERDDSAGARALWSATARAERLIDVAIEGRATDVVFVDAHRVAVANRSNAIDVFDVRTGARARLRDHRNEVVWLAASAKGELASCDINGDVRRWSGNESRSRKHTQQACLGIDFVGDTLWISDGVVARWDADLSLVAAPPSFVGIGGIIGIDDHRALGWALERIVLLDAASSSEVDSMRLSSTVRSLTASAWRPAGAGSSRFFFAGLTDGNVVRFTVDGDALGDPMVVRAHGARVAALATTSDGSLLASAGGSEAVRVGVPGAPALIALVEGPSASVALAFSPDDRLLAALARDRLVVYDLGALVDADRPAGGHVRTVEALDVTNDAVWSGGADGNVIRWDMATARGRVQLRADATVEDLAVSPDGTVVALALSDGRALLMDTRTGQDLGGWIHAGGATSVAFTDDGALLASGGRDGRVQLAGRDGVPRLLGDGDGVNPILSVAVGGPAAGRVVAAGGEGGQVRIFEARAAWRELVTPPRGRERERRCGTVFTLGVDEVGIVSPCNDSRLELRRMGSLGTVEPLGFVDTRIYDLDLRGADRVVAGAFGAWLLGPTGYRQITPQRNVNRARMTVDGAAVFTAADDTTVRRVSLDGAPDAWDVDFARVLRRTVAGAEALVGVKHLDHNERYVCIVDRAGLHMWTAAGESRGVTVPDAAALGVAATRDGCALATTDGARFIVDGNEVARVSGLATAIVRHGDVVVAGIGRDLTFLGPRGEASAEQRTITLEDGGALTALASGAGAGRPGALLAGRSDGNAVLVEGDRVTPLTLADAPATAVTAASFLPRGVIALGFADGAVLAWDADGALVDRSRLHGAVAHLSFSNTEPGLLAVSILGDVTVRLAALDVERCALLRSAWNATGTRPTTDACLAAVLPDAGAGIQSP